MRFKKKKKKDGAGERAGKHVFAALAGWGSWKRGGGAKWRRQRKNRKERGNAGAMLMEGTKGPTPQSKRAVTDHVMKLPPCLLNSGRDRERVRDAK